VAFSLNPCWMNLRCFLNRGPLVISLLAIPNYHIECLPRRTRANVWAHPPIPSCKNTYNNSCHHFRQIYHVQFGLQDKARPIGVEGAPFLQELYGHFIRINDNYRLAEELDVNQLAWKYSLSVRDFTLAKVASACFCYCLPYLSAHSQNLYCRLWAGISRTLPIKGRRRGPGGRGVLCALLSRRTSARPSTIRVGTTKSRQSNWAKTAMGIAEKSSKRI
jgi:hypothetical protein